MRTKIYFLFLIAGFIALDQLSKYIIRSKGGFYICNKNLAFGLSFPTVFIALAFVFLLLIIYNLKFSIFNFELISNFKFKISNYTNLQIIGIILLLSGAISNFVDRLAFSCVIDFIDLKFWPVFNLADVFITIGGIIILLSKNLKIKSKKFR